MNHIKIIFDRGMFKAFWEYDTLYRINGYPYVRHHSRFVFPASTKEQATQRAKDFRTGTGEFKIARPEIKEVVLPSESPTVFS